MFYLLATILLNVLLFAMFKLYTRFKIDSLQAIVFNYLTCVVTGGVFIGRFPIGQDTIAQPWFPWSLALGCCFIGLFNLLAFSTREEGMAATAIANKLSLVIPVAASFLLYDETVNTGKIVGIVLALPAVYLSSKDSDDRSRLRKLWLPAAVFVFSGLMDSFVKYVEQRYLEQSEQQALYTIHCFATAGMVGFLLLAFLYATGRRQFRPRHLLAGILLGVPNFFSIYYLIRLLHSDFLESSAAIPINNIGIVLLTSLAAVFFFGEKSSAARIFGIVLSLAAILLIAFSDLYGV